MFKHYVVVSRDPTELVECARHAMPWQTFLSGLWERRWL
jgi:hypothetical protein